MMKHRLWLLLAVMLLILTAGCTALAEEAVTADTSALTGAGLVLENDDGQNRFYTPVRVGTAVVYAYVDQNGAYVYRVYGTMNGKKGYYPVTLALEANGEEQHFTIALAGETTVRDHTGSGGKPAAEELAEVPEGFTAGRGKTLSLVNLYGAAETFIYGSYDGKTYGFFPSSATGYPTAGSLPIDPEDLAARRLPDGQKKTARPSWLANGCCELVTLITSNGLTVTLPTARPIMFTADGLVDTPAGRMPLAMKGNRFEAEDVDPAYAAFAPFHEDVPEAVQLVESSNGIFRIFGTKRLVQKSLNWASGNILSAVRTFNKALDGIDPDIPVYLYFVDNSRTQPVYREFTEDSVVYNYLKDMLHVDAADHLKYSSLEEFCHYFTTTDNHWNFRGSYQGYVDVVRMMRGEEEELLEPDGIAVIPVYFDGTYNKTRQPISEEYFAIYRFDDFPRYTAYIDGKKREWDHIDDYLNGKYDRKAMTAHYTKCYGGNVGLMTLESEEPSAHGTLLIFGDSFALPLKSMLMKHFKTIVAVDLRYYEDSRTNPLSMSALVEKYGVDEILLVSSHTMYSDRKAQLLRP